MFAVMTTGGKQYRVEAGSELIIERVAGDAGSSITFDRVLLVGDGDDVTVGTPTVEGATVTGTVLGDALGPKLVIFKFKQKVKYRRRTGHRQHLTRVRIDEINANGSSKARARKAATAGEAPAATADATAEKPKRTRKPASKKAEAESSEAAAEKPKRTRKPAAKKAEAEE